MFLCAVCCRLDIDLRNVAPESLTHFDFQNYIDVAGHLLAVPLRLCFLTFSLVLFGICGFGQGSCGQLEVGGGRIFPRTDSQNLNSDEFITAQACLVQLFSDVDHCHVHVGSFAQVVFPHIFVVFLFMVNYELFHGELNAFVSSLKPGSRSLFRLTQSASD